MTGKASSSSAKRSLARSNDEAYHAGWLSRTLTQLRRTHDTGGHVMVTSTMVTSTLLSPRIGKASVQ